MSKKNEPPKAPPAESDKVGYGMPPRHTQFKKGQSGNPRGRPKEVKAHMPVSRIIRHSLSEEVQGQVNGRTRKMTKLEAITCCTRDWRSRRPMDFTESECPDLGHRLSNTNVATRVGLDNHVHGFHVLERERRSRREFKCSAAVQTAKQFRDRHAGRDEADKRHADGAGGELGESAVVHAFAAQGLVGGHRLKAFGRLRHLGQPELLRGAACRKSVDREVAEGLRPAAESCLDDEVETRLLQCRPSKSVVDAAQGNDGFFGSSTCPGAEVPLVQEGDEAPLLQPIGNDTRLAAVDVAQEGQLAGNDGRQR
jgi:hypothetical protein